MTELTVVPVLLSKLLEESHPVYPRPYSWDNTVAFMKSESADWDTVCELIKVLERGEKFREPVYVSFDSPWEEGEYFVPNKPFVSDGTHRVIAHLLYGSEYVDVHYENSGDGVDEPTRYEDETGPVYRCLETVIEFAEPLLEDDSDRMEAEDRMFGAVRSFKVTEDLWFNCDVSSARDLKEFSYMWSERIFDDPALLERITEICTERVRHYIGIEPLSVRTFVDEWVDE
jgi:hypothetical protein